LGIILASHHLMNNSTLDTIFRRRSIRKFTEQPVEPEMLDMLLKAAMAAPTAMNCKPWDLPNSENV
jgi:nitroreductase